MQKYYLGQVDVPDIYVPVANLVPSDDGCGVFRYSISGDPSGIFHIKDDTLFIKKVPPFGTHNIDIYLNDPLNRFPSIHNSFSLDISQHYCSRSTPLTLTLTCPTDQVAVDGNALFSASASINDCSELSYQWQKETLVSAAEVWTPYLNVIPKGQIFSINGVSYGNNVFVAVGHITDKAFISSDGINWTLSTLPVTGYWFDITYGQGKFVALSTGNTSAISYDGISWTAVTFPASADWFGIAYGNNIFVAVPFNQNYAATSTDGINWTLRQLPIYSSGGWRNITYGNSLFVAVSQYGRIISSPDGINWTVASAPILPYYSVAYGNGTFVALGYGTNGYATSTDGINWTQRTMISPNYNQDPNFQPPGGLWFALTYGDGVFVAISAGFHAIAFSDDGINWNQSPILIDKTNPSSFVQVNWFDIVYNGDNFVLVSNEGHTAVSNKGGIQFLDLPGQTGSALPLTGLTNSDNGNRYRVVVDSPIIDAISCDPVVLTVLPPVITITQQPQDVTAAPAGDWSQLGSDIDGEAFYDHSGTSVALSSDGSRVAIGAPFNDYTGIAFNAGHVRIYDWSGSAWVQLGADIDGEAAGDQSGISVALSSDGSRVAIGASSYGNGINSGHLRIYDWSGSAWVQVGDDIGREEFGDRSGVSVALSSDGSRLANGVYGNGGPGPFSGYVRIYDWSGSAWVQLGSDIDSEGLGDYSGSSVALSSDGSRVAIGAYLNDGNGANSGHVRIFDWSGSAWVQVGADIDGEAPGDYSGHSVALSSDGSRVAIGAYLNDGNGADSGHVRIFDWSGSAWVQVGADIDGEAEGDWSGGSVALSSDGSRVAIGAYLNDGNGSQSGHVRIYDWSGSAWVQVGADIDGEAEGDWSGWSVALSSDGSRVAIGAYLNDGNGINSGHVRIYEPPTQLSATFSVSATSSDGSALTYQWQKSDDGVTFANVSGATSSTLSLTGLTAADDNGDQYRVIVYLPSMEPVTSNAATVTVP